MAKEPNIKGGCLRPNRLADLQALSEGLESCQKSLNDYLDCKRNAFPRFFFISDEELLRILGSGDPACVQEHMIKVLCGIQGVLLLFLSLNFLLNIAFFGLQDVRQYSISEV